MSTSAARKTTISIFRRDFCPLWSQKARTLFYSPLGVLVVAVFVAVLCGLVIHPRVFVLAGGLLALIVIGIVWPWIVLRAVRAEWVFDRQRATEGEVIPVAVTIRNPLFLPIPGLRLRGNAEPEVHLATLAARRQIRCEWFWTPSVRGIYPHSPRMVTAFPFGLWEASRGVPLTQSLIVWPRTLPIGAMPAAADLESIDGNVARPKVGTAGDLLGVRPYRRGDSPRRIHWQQSARHDRLIVCELQATMRPRVLVVVDTDPTVHTAGSQGTREWAIRIAASFASGWLDEGAMVGLVAGNTVEPIASGTAQRGRILNALAKLPTVIDSPPPWHSNEVRKYRDAFVIRITTDAADNRSNDSEHRVVLQREGFGGSPGVSGLCVWLSIRHPDDIPRQLRFGWTEAHHGS